MNSLTEDAVEQNLIDLFKNQWGKTRMFLSILLQDVGMRFKL